ncbi:MAG TPA: ATP-binding cassette domain-containing protein [Rhodanobacteraceae bacterium]|nr:ATP-binding cassette domain-containing protein [Rhodanobacteraceae bacterium]
MIAFRNLALRRGPRLLLSGLDAVLHDGWKVGVIGRNGSGKSSLFAAIQGELDSDAGVLDIPAGLRMASVAQETPALPDAAIDYVLGGDAALAAAITDEARANAAGDHAAAARAHHRIDELGGYDGRARAGRLLHGLGFAADMHERAVAEFSGGWRGRLNLARALMAPSDLLLLDEPTNHLDLDAVVWLEQWLRRYPGMLLLISHDREFLDGSVDHILHLEQGGARLYNGNYSDFERQRAERLRQQQIAHDREQAERAHLKSFIDRFKAKATKARQAQSRVKRLEKMAGTEAVRAERAFVFQFPEPARLPQSMLQLEHVEAGYGPQQTILRDVRFRLEAGDRIGLLGPNGAGKSTLVKTLVGELPLLNGARNAHKDLAIGYFAQHTVENLRAGDSPFEHLQDLAPDTPAQVLRDWLGRWHFIGDRAFEPVEVFSGGERARLALALIAWGKPNLLVLDEPTNHLDLDMRGALADALNDYPGALLLVAHDRHLLGLVCDSFLRVADGRVEPFDGDLDDYARWLRSRGSEDADKPEAGKPAGNARERRRDAANERQRQRAQRQQLDKLEARIAAVDHALQALDQRLADPEIYSGPTAVLADIGREQNELRERKATLEAEWLQRYEELDGAEA